MNKDSGVYKDLYHGAHVNLRDALFEQDLEESYNAHLVINNLNALDELIPNMVNTSLDILKESELIIKEANETLEFLIRRGASKESVTGMSVLVYHATRIKGLAIMIAEGPNSTAEGGC